MMTKLILLILILPFAAWAQNDSVELEKKSPIILKSKTSDNLPKPLMVVDGNIVDYDKTINEINPDEIESIKVLKNENAIEKYGEKGKNGVIEIHLKEKENVSFLEKLENQMPICGLEESKSEITLVESVEPFLPQKPSIIIRDPSTKFKNNYPNIVMNGELVSREEVRNLDPNDIESVQIIKNVDNVYSHQNLNGTILIKTKDSNYELTEYDLAVLDLGYDSFLAMQPSAETYSLGYLQNKNKQYVSVWNSRVYTGNPEIYEMPIDYDSQTFYGLDFEYKLFQFFKFMEDKYKISMM
ncbi:MAG TPA: DUF6146 family protein [Moheibacter sp.]|nr:DUF6146 family protein [Moheibacter sp.]